MLMQLLTFELTPSNNCNMLAAIESGVFSDVIVSKIISRACANGKTESLGRMAWTDFDGER